MIPNLDIDLIIKGLGNMKKPKTKQTKNELIESLTGRLNVAQAAANAEENLKRQARAERDEARAQLHDANDRLRALRVSHEHISEEHRALRKAGQEAHSALTQSLNEIIKLAIQAAVAETSLDGTKHALDRAFADLRDLLRLGDVRISLVESEVLGRGTITVSLDQPSLPIKSTSSLTTEQIEGKKSFAGFMLHLFRAVGGTLKAAGGQSRNRVVNLGADIDPTTYTGGIDGTSDTGPKGVL